jgi:hypothetical protein
MRTSSLYDPNPKGRDSEAPKGLQPGAPRSETRRGETCAERRWLLRAKPRHHVVVIAVRERIAGSHLRLADPADPMNRVDLRNRDHTLTTQSPPQPLERPAAADEGGCHDRHVEDHLVVLRGLPPLDVAARDRSQECERAGGLRALRDAGQHRDARRCLRPTTWTYTTSQPSVGLVLAHPDRHQLALRAGWFPPNGAAYSTTRERRLQERRRQHRNGTAAADHGDVLKVAFSYGCGHASAVVAVSDSAVIVGRAAERAQLASVLCGVVDRAVAAVVEVVGEPGIGKTTMLGALAVDAVDAGCLVLEGRAAEFERDAPFGVLVDAIDVHLAGLDHGRVQRLGPHLLGQLAAVFPALEEHAGGPARIVDSERFRLHRAVRSLLERLAAGRGLVLLLDDLHWADAASCELVASLLRRPPDAAVLVAVAYRSGRLPTMLVSELAVAARAGTLRRVELGPLTREQADLLAEAASLSPAARQRLFTDSGGNPFYLEQLARAAQHASPDSVAAIGQRRIGDALTGDVPADVAAALALELAILSESARAVAQVAAIAGEPFDLDLVADITGLPDDAVLGALDELLERDLVRSTAVPREFRFRHPLDDRFRMVGISGRRR